MCSAAVLGQPDVGVEPSTCSEVVVSVGALIPTGVGVLLGSSGSGEVGRPGNRGSDHLDPVVEVLGEGEDSVFVVELHHEDQIEIVTGEAEAFTNLTFTVDVDVGYQAGSIVHHSEGSLDVDVAGQCAAEVVSGDIVRSAVENPLSNVTRSQRRGGVGVVGVIARCNLCSISESVTITVGVVRIGSGIVSVNKDSSVGLCGVSDAVAVGIVRRNPFEEEGAFSIELGLDHGVCDCCIECSDSRDRSTEGNWRAVGICCVTLRTDGKESRGAVLVTLMRIQRNMVL